MRILLPVIWESPTLLYINYNISPPDRFVRILHNDYENRSNGLLEINNEATFHVKNNQKLTIDVYKYISQWPIKL